MTARPLIVAPVGGDDPVALARRAAEGGADLLEYRVDLTPPPSWEVALLRMRSAVKLPVLLTVRSPREGGFRGFRPLDDAHRARVFHELLPHARGADLELSSPILLGRVAPPARRAGKILILSYHNFRSVPSPVALDRLLRRAGRWPGATLKVAARARASIEVTDLLLWCLRAQPRRVAVVPIGEPWRHERMAAWKFGSCLAYAHAGWPTAPGQPSLREMRAALASGDE